MKAISPVRSVRSCLEAVCCLSEQSLGIARGSGLALGKACPSAEEPASLLDDMNGCYSKLRELVPGIPQGSQLSQVEILQHVIDYIFDLQIVLQEQAQEKKSRSRKDTAGQPAALQAAELASELCSKEESPCH
nr:DNA-binding protein inhibitor ID-3 isoform X2 [Anolis sagrei ordinatus]